MIKFKGGADYTRWATQTELSSEWDERTRLIAAQIKPGTSVLEFGAGRMILKQHLPEECLYTPSDLVDRGEGTLVCDLNGREIPAFPRHDVAVFSGVLEYINDLPRLVAHLAGSVNEVIASYAVLEHNPRDRRANGWVNDFTSEQLLRIFAAAGFHPEHCVRWRNQMIYRFAKQGGRP